MKHIRFGLLLHHHAIERLKIEKAFKVRLPHVKQQLFTKYLLATNLTISFAFSGIGDIVVQLFDNGRRGEIIWNKMRTLKMATTGLTTGTLTHYWFICVDKYYKKETFKSMLIKTFLTQTIFSPINIVAFFLTMSILNKSNVKDTIDKILDKGVRILKTELIVWTPAYFLNFYFISLKYRVFFDATISFGFDIYNSYIYYKKAA
jgi:hypothetical protein